MRRGACHGAGVLLLYVIVAWLVLSLPVTAVVCALCRAGHLEDMRLGRDG